MADEITQEQYISRHTGEEIDNAVDNATLVLANPTEEATEELTKLNIANTIFSIAAGGSSVIVRTWSDTEEENGTI